VTFCPVCPAPSAIPSRRRPGSASPPGT
jgi:hypothetical protein